MGTNTAGSNTGVYYIVVDNQGVDWLVVGVLVAGDSAWVAGRWDSRTAAEEDAARWTALESEVEAA